MAEKNSGAAASEKVAALCPALPITRVTIGPHQKISTLQLGYRKVNSSSRQQSPDFPLKIVVTTEKKKRSSRQQSPIFPLKIGEDQNKKVLMSAVSYFFH